MFVIDDCTHGFGGQFKGQLNGTIADASFFSTQWNKPYSTGIGGFAIVKDACIAKELSLLEKLAVKPSLKDEWVLSSLIRIREKIFSPRMYWTLLNIYRRLSENNLIIGSSSGEELQMPTLPENFLKGLSIVQVKKGLEEIEKVNYYNSHRRKIAGEYNKVLKNCSANRAFEPSYSRHIYLKYPILVRDRQKFMREAQRSRIELGDWFISPIHPVKANYSLWGYQWGTNPVAENISQHIVNLPTHPGIDKRYLNKIITFLYAKRDNLLKE